MLPAVRVNLSRYVRGAYALVLCLAWGSGAWAAPALWEVSDARGVVRAHLFGTVHVCNAECYPLPAAVREAFAQDARLALELDTTDPEVMATVASAGLLPAGQRLRARLPAALAGAMSEAATRLGLPIDLLDTMQPWFVSTLLLATAAQQAGFSLDAGIDQVLQMRAQAAGKPLVSLESAQRQVAALSAGGEPAQLAALRQTVDMINDGSMGDYLGRMVAAWRAGDDDGMRALMTEGLDQQLAAPLLAELIVARNREMAQRIHDLLGESGRLFVAVGGGHLIGERNIPDELVRLGWRVRRVRH